MLLFINEISSTCTSHRVGVKESLEFDDNLFYYDMNGRLLEDGTAVITISESLLPEPVDLGFCALEHSHTITLDRIGEEMDIALGDPVVVPDCLFLDPEEHTVRARRVADKRSFFWPFMRPDGSRLWVLQGNVCDLGQI